MPEKKIRPIAFYLPQFHRTPENDKWWGNGFTEWTLVSRSKPLIKGHYQPHLPADLGFYDLNVDGVMEEQALLAKEAGLFGFMFYHYWFHGKRFLEMPVNKMLKSGKPDFPFCLCWANETWTRAWVGNPNEILIQQSYSTEDDVNHMTYLCSEVFPDSRYIKIFGKPLLGIWETNEIPDMQKTADLWQEIAIKNGFPGVYLISVADLSTSKTPESEHLDAVAEFAPDWHRLPPNKKHNFSHKILNFLNIYRSPYYDNRIMQYSDLVSQSLGKEKPLFKYFPGVAPSWDNTPRNKVKNAYVFYDSTPEKFEYWLAKTIKEFTPYSEEENFIFINAWNEWSEGAHLEPCERHGRGYLNALKKVMKNEH